jgi:hypothetical protein
MMRAFRTTWNVSAMPGTLSCTSRTSRSLIPSPDRVSNIKTVEEITMKKPRTMTDLLVVADVCIKASKAWARLLESRGNGPSKKNQDDRDVNTTDRGDQGDQRDHGDHGYRGNRQQQSVDQKEKRLFYHPADEEKWCEIHRTTGHDLEECKTFLDCKKMPPPAAPVSQKPHRGEHRWVVPNNSEHMGEINVIFGGSMSIASKTQGKKLEREISLAHLIEPGRKMKWSDMDLLFRPEDHPET